MKKVLATVAALGMVAAFAGSASALELKVKGKYEVDGIYHSDGLGGAAGNGVALAGDQTSSDMWYQHVFQVEPTLVVNKQIMIKSRIRIIDADTIWGSQDDLQTSDGGNFNVKRLWMVYKSGIGQWEIGRRPAGAWMADFVSSGSQADRIMWKSGKLLGDNFSMYAFYQKSTEGDAYRANDDDNDNDYYEVYGGFKGGWGKAGLAAAYAPYHAANANTTASNEYGINQTTGNIEQTTTDMAYGYEKDFGRIKGYGNFKFGANMGMEVEFDWKFGTVESNNAAVADKDIDTWAYIADFYANLDSTKVHAMYFHTDGDNTNDNDLSAYDSTHGTGDDFTPLYILTGEYTGILNGNESGTAFGAAARKAGVDGIAISADVAVSEKLTLRGAIGMASASDEMSGYDSDYGWEVNFGLGYKLLDNLTYELHLGYLATGDFFKMGTTYNDVNDITLATHTLSMKF